MPQEECEKEAITILVNGSTLTCDKHVLVKESDYFRAMFESSMIESQTNTVTLHDQDYDLVSTLVSCMETGELSITEENIRPLTEAAVMLQIKGAMETCSSYLISRLDDRNCFELNTYARSLVLDKLYNSSKRHALYYFKGVCATTTFLDLDIATLKEYLNDPHINCDSELDIVDALYKWYKHGIDGRGEYLECLLQCVRPGDLDETEWIQLAEHSVVTNTEPGGAWYKSATLTREQATQGDTLEKYRQVPMQFLTIGGITETDDKTEFCTTIGKFDESKRDFVPFQTLKDIFTDYGPKMGFQVTVMGKDMYVTGGQPKLTRGQFNMDVWKFDCFLNTWKNVSQLTIQRRHHGTCASQTDLYLLGGFGKYRSILDSAQKYDTLTGEWEDLPPIPKQCFTPLCTYIDGKIYLNKQVTFCFDTQTNTWTEITWLQVPSHVVFQTIPYKQHIYWFPFIDIEIDWFYESEESGFMAIVKLDSENEEKIVMQHSDGFQPGNRVVVCNRKFYSINRYDNKFVQGYMEDMSCHKVLGDRESTPYNAFLVALPDYPRYTVNDR